MQLVSSPPLYSRPGCVELLSAVQVNHGLRFAQKVVRFFRIGEPTDEPHSFTKSGDTCLGLPNIAPAISYFITGRIGCRFLLAFTSSKFLPEWLFEKAIIDCLGVSNAILPHTAPADQPWLLIMSAKPWYFYDPVHLEIFPKIFLLGKDL